jgi:hypothetical protein
LAKKKRNIKSELKRQQHIVALRVLLDKVSRGEINPRQDESN